MAQTRLLIGARKGGRLRDGERSRSDWRLTLHHTFWLRPGHASE